MGISIDNYGSLYINPSEHLANPINRAIVAGCPESVKYLLENGAPQEMEATGPYDGYSPLMIAIEEINDPVQMHEMVSLLVEHGQNANQKIRVSSEIPLFGKVFVPSNHEQSFKKMLEDFIDVRVSHVPKLSDRMSNSDQLETRDGRDYLIFVPENDSHFQTKLTEMLNEKQSKHTHNPASIISLEACGYHSPYVSTSFDLLLRKSILSDYYSSTMQTLLISADHDENERVGVLETENVTNGSPFQQIIEGYPIYGEKILLAFLNHGDNINDVFKSGHFKGHTPLSHALELNRLSLANTLVENGANVDIVMTCGQFTGFSLRDLVNMASTLHSDTGTTSSESKTKPNNDRLKHLRYRLKYDEKLLEFLKEIKPLLETQSNEGQSTDESSTEPKTAASSDAS
ncbi:MAG: ankyrin repeat domain-containing protein [Alphaproteobacteria bacterium]|nr:ankyrin repeat domain-containing protein [Alphaproteobacteria bacterium]MBT5389233.1 ankyrin repeat domain-containing protein [Alphaproteobacteria bacterium]